MDRQRRNAAAEQQQYDRAIATYNDAIQVAPNNPLDLTTMPTRELAQDITHRPTPTCTAAVMQDPSVLIGCHLQKHLGADHVRDLSEISNRMLQDTPKEPTHAFSTRTLYS